MRDALRDRIREARNAREDTEQARAETGQRNRYLEREADGYRTIVEAAPDGDLTARMDPESEATTPRTGQLSLDRSESRPERWQPTSRHKAVVAYRSSASRLAPSRGSLRQ